MKPILIMDRGIATKANLTLMRGEGYPFLVIQRRDEAKSFEAHFRQAPEGFTEVAGRDDGERVWLKRIAPAEGKGGPLARILSQSEGRAEKKRGIDRLKEQRLLEDLEKMHKAIAKGYLKDTAKAN